MYKFGMINGCISDHGTLIVIAAQYGDSDDAEANILAIRKENKWSIFQEDFDITAVAVGRGPLSRAMLTLGSSGEFAVMTTEKVYRGKFKNGSIPNQRVTLQDCRIIGNKFYTVGMRRQAYAVSADGKWTEIAGTMLQKNNDNKVCGLVSVDGLSESKIYSCGYSGEVWKFNGSKWQSLPKVTDCFLSCIRCLPSGVVMVAGESGTIIQGKKDKLVLLKQELTQENILSIAELKGIVYFSTEDGKILSLVGNKFSILKLPQKKFDYLDANQEFLLAIGEKDISMFDGKKWQVVKKPSL